MSVPGVGAGRLVGMNLVPFQIGTFPATNPEAVSCPMSGVFAGRFISSITPTSLVTLTCVIFSVGIVPIIPVAGTVAAQSLLVVLIFCPPVL